MKRTALAALLCSTEVSLAAALSHKEPTLVHESFNLQDLASRLVGEAEDDDAVNELENDQAHEAAVKEPETDARDEEVADTEKDVSPSALDDSDLAAKVIKAAGKMEQDNGQLKARLGKADKKQRELKSQVVEANNELRKVPELQRQLHDVVEEKNAQKVQLVAERQREQQLELQVLNSSRVASNESEVLSLDKSHVEALQRQNSRLAKFGQNVTRVNRYLRSKLHKAESARSAMGAAFNAVKEQFARIKDAGVSERGQFEHVVAEKDKAVEQAQASEKAEDLEHQKSEADDKTIKEMRAELAQADKRIAREEKHESELASQNSRLSGLLSLERSNETQLTDQLFTAASKTREQEVKIDLLKRHVEADKAAHDKLEIERSVASKLEEERAADVKQLRGSIPWLQAKVTDDEQVINKSSAETRTAYEARDAAQAMLAETQRKMVQLERQYATVVQELAGKGASDSDDVLAVAASIPEQDDVEMQDSSAPMVRSPEQDVQADEQKQNFAASSSGDDAGDAAADDDEPARPAVEKDETQHMSNGEDALERDSAGLVEFMEK